LKAPPSERRARAAARKAEPTPEVEAVEGDEEVPLEEDEEAEEEEP
jgi:hypothetical protein